MPKFQCVIKNGITACYTISKGAIYQAERIIYNCAGHSRQPCQEQKTLFPLKITFAGNRESTEYLPAGQAVTAICESWPDVISTKIL